MIKAQVHQFILIQKFSYYHLSKRRMKILLIWWGKCDGKAAEIRKTLLIYHTVWLRGDVICVQWAFEEREGSPKPMQLMRSLLIQKTGLKLWRNNEYYELIVTAWLIQITLTHRWKMLEWDDQGEIHFPITRHTTRRLLPLVPALGRLHCEPTVFANLIEANQTTIFMTFQWKARKAL